MSFTSVSFWRRTVFTDEKRFCLSDPTGKPRSGAIDRRKEKFFLSGIEVAGVLWSGLVSRSEVRHLLFLGYPQRCWVHEHVRHLLPALRGGNDPTREHIPVRWCSCAHRPSYAGVLLARRNDSYAVVNSFPRHELY